MKIPTFLLFLAFAFATGAQAYNVAKGKSPEISRRNLLATAAASATAVLVGASNPRLALADDDVPTPLYFGVGVSLLLVRAKQMFVPSPHACLIPTRFL